MGMDWKELHAAISRLGLTQLEIAKESGVPQPTVSQVLSRDPNKSLPRLPTYLKLQAFYQKKRSKPSRKKVG